MQRKDDNAEALKKRMASYHTQTAPILDYYRSHNVLASVNAMQSIGDVSKQIDDAIYQNMKWDIQYSKF